MQPAAQASLIRPRIMSLLLMSLHLTACHLFFCVLHHWEQHLVCVWYGAGMARLPDPEGPLV